MVAKQALLYRVPAPAPSLRYLGTGTVAPKSRSGRRSPGRVAAPGETRYSNLWPADPFLAEAPPFVLVPLAGENGHALGTIAKRRDDETIEDTPPRHDRHPGRPPQSSGKSAPPARLRAAHGDGRCRLRHGWPSRGRARRRRADGGAALSLRHAQRPHHLGRRPPGLPAQDPHRAPRPHPHPAQGWRPIRLHQSLGERVRPVRRRPFLDFDLGRPRHGGRQQILRQGQGQRRRRDRRRRDVGRHGLRGDEQRWRHARAAHRDPQRQRDVDRPAGRRAVGLSRPARLGGHLSHRARDHQAARQAPAEVRLRPRPQDGRIRPQLLGWRHDVRGARLLLRRSDRRP